MAVEPKVAEDIIEEIAKRNAERLKEGLLNALDTGWLIFRKGRPQERLAGYLAATLSADMPYVLDADYAAKYRAGLAPPLLAVQMQEQREIEAAAAESMLAEAAAAGMPMEAPQLPAAPPPLWPEILTLPDYVFAALSRDFSHVLKEQAKREEYA